MAALSLVPSGARTLVVGAGFLGTAIAEALVAAGQPVTVLSRGPLDPSAAVRLAGARVVRGDAADALTLHDAFEDVGDVVFCAGASLPAAAELDPLAAERESIPPLLQVLETLRRRPGVPLLYLSSGGTVYGEPTATPVPENHPLRPQSVYAAIKVAAEQHLLVYRRQHGVPATALRCANPYGVGQRSGRGQGVIAALVAAKGPVPIFGDSSVRDYIDARDVAAVVVELRGRVDLPPAINVGTGIGTSLRELLAMIQDASGASIDTVLLPPRATDLRCVVLDISLLRGLFHFSPRSLAAGLLDLLGLEARTAAEA